MPNNIQETSLLSLEDNCFLIESFKWLLRNYGGGIFFKQTPLILPAKEFFPELFNGQKILARTVFKHVQKYAGMAEWPCELKTLVVETEHVTNSFVGKESSNSPLGTFSDKNPENVVIEYDPSLTSRPVQLIATFAHEFAHYLTKECPEPPPGGWNYWDPATDITAVFMGFGIFMANSVFTFRKCQQGDQYGSCVSKSGYLSEEMATYALGIFLKLKEINPYTIYRYLEPNIKKMLVACLEELDKSETIKELMNVEYVR